MDEDGAKTRERKKEETTKAGTTRLFCFFYKTRPKETPSTCCSIHILLFFLSYLLHVS